MPLAGIGPEIEDGVSQLISGYPIEKWTSCTIYRVGDTGICRGCKRILTLSFDNVLLNEIPEDLLELLEINYLVFDPKNVSTQNRN